MLDLRELAPDTFRPIRRVEYERMVELGLFAQERLELLRGMLVTLSPLNARHAETVARLTEWLVVALDGRAYVRPLCPFAASDDSEPEPDLAVVPRRDYGARHPGEALLLIEVAEGALTKDQRVKARLYAECGVPEYWIVNLSAGGIEVRSHLQDGAYARTRRYGRGRSITLTVFPDVTIAVDDVVPLS